MQQKISKFFNINQVAVGFILLAALPAASAPSPAVEERTDTDNSGIMLFPNCLQVLLKALVMKYQLR
ncbi:MAG TPA: hypothetical protein VJH24_02785 [Candidatus Bilamarchaeaceae archaeon]|nr:hypothetical protein [Candidatus Bilamarchaeaceae archaeon]